MKVKELFADSVKAERSNGMTEEQIRAFLMEYTETVGNAETEYRAGHRQKVHELYAKADGMRKALEILGCTEEVKQFYADMCGV